VLGVAAADELAEPDERGDGVGATLSPPVPLAAGVAEAHALPRGVAVAGALARALPLAPREPDALPLSLALAVSLAEPDGGALRAPLSLAAADAEAEADVRADGLLAGEIDTLPDAAAATVA